MKPVETLPTETVGKAEKFQHIMGQFHQALFRYYALHANGNLQKAYELTGATFLLLHRKQESFELPGFHSELFGIAWDVLNAHCNRKDARTKCSHNRAQNELEPELLQMLNVMRTLPFYPREIFYLRFFADLAPSDIAALMDKNDTTVKVIVYQALMDVTAKLQGKAYIKPLPWKKLVLRAQVYHCYLNDLLVGIPPQPYLDEDALRVTCTLAALRRSISMTPSRFASLQEEVMQTIHKAHTSITPL